MYVCLSQALQITSLLLLARHWNAVAKDTKMGKAISFARQSTDVLTEIEIHLGHHSMPRLPSLPVLAVVAPGFTSTPSIRRCHIARYASEPGS